MSTPMHIPPHATILRPPDTATTTKLRYNNAKPVLSFQKRRSISVSSNATSSSSEPQKPEIELEFIGPKAGDGIEKARAVSGEKLLRSVMLDNKIELYATYGQSVALETVKSPVERRFWDGVSNPGKVMNCGGGGTCGTCIVEILDGKDLLNERTNTELRYLKKKPESWRLACQTIVGNKENSGKVVVQRMPQWKK